MLFVRKASANRFWRPSVAKVLFARGLASIAARRSSGIVVSRDRRVRRAPAAVRLGSVDLLLPCRLHAPCVGQPLHVLAVDLTPDTLGASGRIPLQERLVVEPFANTVDPPPAEHDIESLPLE